MDEFQRNLPAVPEELRQLLPGFMRSTSAQVPQVQNRIDAAAQTVNRRELMVGEIFQKLQSIKELHFLGLMEIYERLSIELNQVQIYDNNIVRDAINVEKVKYFMSVVDRLITLLLLDKEKFLQEYVYIKDRIDIYEQQILTIIDIRNKVPHGVKLIINGYLQTIMESNSRPGQGEPDAGLGPTTGPGSNPVAEPDWRSQFPSEARQTVLDRIIDTIEKHLPAPDPEILSKRLIAAARFEERTYNAATSQHDYLRKISIKLDQIQKKTQSPQMNGSLDSGTGGMESQAGTNPARSGAMPVLNQRPLIPQSIQNNRREKVGPNQQRWQNQLSFPQKIIRHKLQRQLSSLTRQAVMQLDAMTTGMNGGMQEQQNQLNPLLQQTQGSAVQVPSQEWTAEFTNPEAFHAGANSAMNDIGPVMSMADLVSGSAQDNGYRAAMGDDLAAEPPPKKMKRYTTAMPLNHNNASDVGPGVLTENLNIVNGLDTSELHYTASSCVKTHKAEMNRQLMDEIKDINAQLVDSELSLSEEQADFSEGTVIKCTYSAVNLSSGLRSHFASLQLSPILPLRLLLPASYPNSFPIILDQLREEQSWNLNDLEAMVRSRLSASLKGLSQPLTLREIAQTWDSCARDAIVEFAQMLQSINSIYGGTWQSCTGTDT